MPSEMAHMVLEVVYSGKPLKVVAAVVEVVVEAESAVASVELVQLVCLVEDYVLDYHYVNDGVVFDLLNDFFPCVFGVI